MTDTYTITFTDQTSNRSFQIRPFTVNGPANPNDTLLVDAATSLQLFGKGAPDYGPGMASNLVYLLENFASVVEPVYPVAGQVWYDRSGLEFSDGQLFVYNPLKHPIVAITTGPTSSLIEIAGDHTARFGSAITTRLTNTTGAESTQLLFIQAVPPVSFSAGTTKITVKPAISGGIAGKFLGGWESIAEEYLQRDGSIPLDGGYTPTADQDIATKKYVDDEVAGVGGTFVDETGDTMTGNLVMSGVGVHVILPNAPTDGTHAANKAYVDSTLVTDHGGLSGLGDNDHPQYLLKTGGTITGTLTLTGGTTQILLPNTPTAPSHATRKLYVDTADNALQDQIIVSGSFAGDQLTLFQDDGGTIVISGISTTGGNTTQSVHISNPDFQQGLDGDQINESWYFFPTFPNVTLNNIIQTFSEITWLTRQKNKRTVQISSGSPAVSFTVQDYVVGFNNLQTFVNGVKQIANTRGSQRISHDPLGSPITSAAAQNTAGYFHGISTGLANDATVYTMTVFVDGGSPGITVSVIGQDAQNFSNLLDEINADLAPFASAVIEEESIIIYSATGGTGSSISIVDGNLISSLIGEDPTGSPAPPTWDSSTTFNPGDVVQFTGSPTPGFYVALQQSTNFPPPANPDHWRLVLAYNSVIGASTLGTTYGYEEDGLYGTSSTSITFTASVPDGSTIETITLGQQRSYGR